MTRTLIAVLLVAGITFSAAAIVYRKKEPHKTSKPSPVNPARSASLILQSKATLMKNYLRNSGYNEEVCFFINMGMASGKKRFFAYNLKTGTIITSGLVAHGSGGGSTFDTPEYSNKTGSNCTSLGKYKVGQSYHGQFGLAYKLHGLEKTNNNAFNRFVVLHAHECVPDSDIYPDNICMSWGCPTVSPGFLKQLAVQIDKSEKPILLEIYEEQ